MAESEKGMFFSHTASHGDNFYDNKGQSHPLPGRNISLSEKEASPRLHEAHRATMTSHIHFRVGVWAAWVLAKDCTSSRITTWAMRSPSGQANVALLVYM